MSAGPGLGTPLIATSNLLANAGSNYNSEYLNLMQLQAKLFFERISGTLLFRASFIKILRHVTPGLVHSTFTH